MYRLAVLLCIGLWLAPPLPACQPPTIGADDVAKLLGDEVDKSTTWEAWWKAHQELFFTIPRKLAGGADLSGSQATYWKAAREKAIETLAQTLRTAKPSNVRMHAALSLGKIGGPAQRAALARAITEDKSRVVRFVATLALGMLGDEWEIGRLSRILDDPRAHRLQRAYAGVGLGFIGATSYLAAQEVVPLLVRKLHPRTDRGVQLGVLLGLGAIRTDEVIGQLTRLLADRRRHKLVRAVAAAALGRQDSPLAVAALASTIGHRKEDKLVTQAVALALGQLHTRESRIALLRIIAGPRDDLTAAFAWLSLARHRDRSQTRLLLEKLACAPFKLRPFAALALGVQGDPASAPALRAYLQKYRNNESHHAAGALGLGLLRDKKVVPGLLERMPSMREPAQLGHVAAAVGLAGDLTAQAGLLSVYKQRARWAPVRLAGTIALLKLGSVAPFELLPKDMATAQQIQVRRASAWALGETADKRVVDALLAQVRQGSADDELRVKAAKALGHLLDRSRHHGMMKPFSFGFNYRASALDLTLHNIFIIP